jgi:hypothetical protein
VRLGERRELRSGHIGAPVGYEPFDMGNSGYKDYSATVEETATLWYSTAPCNDHIY